MSNKLKLPKANKGKGYVGVITNYRGEEIGFDLPGAMIKGIAYMPNVDKGKRVFLCEITVKPLKDKKGRPITKIVK